MKKMSCALAVVLALLIAVPGAAQAQDNNGNINITWSKAFYDDTNFLNSVFSFGYSRNMGSWILQVQAPFSIYDPDVTGLDGDSAFGNPRIGFMKYTEGAPIAWGVGIRAPMAPDDKSAVGSGYLADPIFAGTWRADYLTADFMVAWSNENEGGITPMVYGGVELSYYTGDLDIDSTEFFIPFMAAVSYPMANGSLMGGLAGNFWLTEDDGVNWDNPLLMAGVGYTFAMGNVSPELWFGIPISSEYGDAVDFFFSVGFGFGIP
jgi:hypothetical protein